MVTIFLEGYNTRQGYPCLVLWVCWTVFYARFLKAYYQAIA